MHIQINEQSSVPRVSRGLGSHPRKDEIAGEKRAFRAALARRIDTLKFRIQGYTGLTPGGNTQ